MVKKADVILFICIVLLSLSLLIFLLVFPKSNGDTLVITVNGAEYCRAPLNKDTEITLEHNTVVIKDGEAFMKSADCKDKICINQGKINAVGETVVCIPGGVILEVE